MRGKLIVIEGTDCSGKETQTRLLMEKFKKEGIKVERLSFPMYDTPTGKIIGACYLGKPYLCKELFKEEKSWFEEGATSVDPLVAIDLYAADRRYNLPKIEKLLNEGINVIIDRYVGSNMAHQGCKIYDEKQRINMFKLIEEKEYIINKMPVPDISVFLYMPYEQAKILRLNREEEADQHESDEAYLRNAEATYLDLVGLYDYKKIDCVNNNKVRTIEDINNDLYNHVIKIIK